MKQFIISILFCILIIPTGCVNAPHQEESHEHDHANETIMIPYWGYNDHVEVFIDTEPMVKGKAFAMLVHLTDLKNFKALTPQKVTAKLIIGTKGLKQVQEQNLRPGVFQFLFQPDESGEGYLLFEFENSGVKEVIKVQKIKVYVDAHTATHEAEEQMPDVPGAISFTKEKSWKVGFATDHPAKQPFGKIIKTTAKLEALPTDRIVVSAKTSGFISYANGVVTSGKTFQQNEQIFIIKGNGISDNNASVMLKKAKAELELSEADYERDKLLAEKQIVSDKQMQETKARYQKTLSEYNNLKESIGEDGEKVVAPINGFVSEVLVNNGQFVKAGDPLFSMVLNHRLMLTAMLGQNHLKDLQNVTGLNVEVGHKILSLADLNGKVLSVGKSISKNNHLIPVVFEVDRKDELISEGFANVYVKTSGEEALVIPESALTEEQGVYFVYVQLTPELFEKRQVKVGASDGQYRAVLSGVGQNDRVVTKGAVLVKLAAVSGTIDPHAGHVH